MIRSSLAPQQSLLGLIMFSLSSIAYAPSSSFNEDKLATTRVFMVFIIFFSVLVFMMKTWFPADINPPIRRFMMRSVIWGVWEGKRKCRKMWNIKKIYWTGKRNSRLIRPPLKHIFMNLLRWCEYLSYPSSVFIRSSCDPKSRKAILYARQFRLCFFCNVFISSVSR